MQRGQYTFLTIFYSDHLAKHGRSPHKPPGARRQAPGHCRPLPGQARLGYVPLMSSDLRPWWQSAVVYQIYPRSFQDSNSDGIGDLPGITRRLDYLSWLGVSAIWVSPIYPSPMADFGYDVSDHTAIDPVFGTMQDFDNLVAEAHSRRLRVILDYVPNHTSIAHPWFVESRTSLRNPKRDWYIWRAPGPGGGVPNNWTSAFGGPTWELDPTTGQYYCHTYLREQPDLNWHNPKVREAMFDVLRFWMARGVDGFRVDALRRVAKDPLFRDNPPNPDWRPEMGPHKRELVVHSGDTEEIHEVIRSIRQVLDDAGGDRLFIGEFYVPLERLVKYYGASGEGCHLPFNFQLILAAWHAPTLGRLIAKYEGLLPDGAWPNWVLGNHDNHRIATRIGTAQARVAAMLLLTLRGTPTIYYGDEIGMTDVPIPPNQVQDPWERNVPGLGFGRDPERTPMQWEPKPGGGFTQAEAWLPMPRWDRMESVVKQQTDPRSMLALTRALLILRRQERSLSAGAFKLVGAEGDVLSYLRTAPGHRPVLVMLNLGHEDATADVPVQMKGAGVNLSTWMDRAGERAGGELGLRGDEGVILSG